MAENGANLPNEAQFDEFENDEVGAGTRARAHDEEGAADLAVPEIPHSVEAKAQRAVISRCRARML